MVVVRVASVGVAGGLGCGDLRGERVCPFAPGEDAFLMQGEGHGERLRLPRLGENGAGVIPGLTGEGGGRVRQGAGSRYGSHASTETMRPGGDSAPHSSRPSKATV